MGFRVGWFEVSFQIRAAARGSDFLFEPVQTPKKHLFVQRTSERYVLFPFRRVWFRVSSFVKTFLLVNIIPVSRSSQL